MKYRFEVRWEDWAEFEVDAENEVEAASYDPVQNPELVADMAELAAFANDPAMIDIQLLDNHQVKLMVAEEYLSFVKDNNVVMEVRSACLQILDDNLMQILHKNRTVQCLR